MVGTAGSVLIREVSFIQSVFYKICTHTYCTFIKVARSESATAMLVHFQKLFDVREPIGVCTRMSEVYCKLSQCQNVIRTLQSTLTVSEFVCIVPLVIHNRL